jgi:hypothetical protein
MRESRTEDIVREIYLAVNERDYWISFFNPSWRLTTPQRTLPLLDRAGRMRVENQMQYIYNTVKTWITPFSDINPPTSGNFYTLNESCFLDEESPFDLNLVSDPEYKPFKSLERRWYGRKNLDYSQGGTLEALLNYDLILFRNYKYKRIDLTFLKMIYDLLNLDLKISNAYTRMTASINEGQSRILNFPLNDDSFNGFSIRLSSSKSWNNSVLNQDGFNENFDLFNAITENTPPTSEGSYVKNNGLPLSQSGISCVAQLNGSGFSGLSTDYSYGSFNMMGFSDRFDMNISDIEINDYAYIQTFSNFYDYLPTLGSNLNLGVNSYIPTIENINGDDFFLYTNLDPRPWSYAIAPPDNSGIRQQEDFRSYPVIYLNINNQEGFLNYYTEPAP